MFKLAPPSKSSVFIILCPEKIHYSCGTLGSEQGAKERQGNVKLVFLFSCSHCVECLSFQTEETLTFPCFNYQIILTPWLLHHRNTLLCQGHWSGVYLCLGRCSWQETSSDSPGNAGQRKGYGWVAEAAEEEMGTAAKGRKGMFHDLGREYPSKGSSKVWNTGYLWMISQFELQGGCAHAGKPVSYSSPKGTKLENSHSHLRGYLWLSFLYSRRVSSP